MKKISRLYYYCYFFSGFLFFTSQRVEAAPRPLTDLGYFHWANQAKTPADNTFIMHYSDDLSVKSIILCKILYNVLPVSH